MPGYSRGVNAVCWEECGSAWLTETDCVPLHHVARLTLPQHTLGGARHVRTVGTLQRAFWRHRRERKMEKYKIKVHYAVFNSTVIQFNFASNIVSQSRVDKLLQSRHELSGIASHFATLYSWLATLQTLRCKFNQRKTTRQLGRPRQTARLLRSK